MRRNCNLELRLFPSHDSDHHVHHHPIMGEGDKNHESEMMSPEDEGQQQKLTIFYDGKVCVSDVTDLQARWIMKEATKEVEEKMKRSLSSSSLGQSQMCSPNTALSMKRSLQRFLQKRKDRIHESSPYHP
ncbi:protein TIFY 5A-like [Prosopis cineraria]|uniref:protein TIFY 5A-like n=1 Tax=Prosopis cineraria TaxID=364024 RepID=UPI0024101872|nr:protein TIFY 5A-like [Prosopis cineraria]XP_054779436.1 protein TIFY 5A-like [Prosopis cineraria]